MLAAVIVLAVLLAIAICLLAVLVMRERTRTRSAQLHEQFGREYERTLHDAGNRRNAERELADRQRRHDELHIRPLDPMQRQAFAASWREVQTRFVDEPREAVTDADRLVRDVMAERGYPMADFDRQSADLSVEHADVIGHYRAAHDIQLRDVSGESTTEELREAMVHYRALFESLLAPSEEATSGRSGARSSR